MACTRTLNVLDEGNRQGLAIEVGTSIPSTHVVRVVEQLIKVYGELAAVRVDNGPELTAQEFVDWCALHSIELRYIEPGKPDQNAYFERFNRNHSMAGRGPARVISNPLERLNAEINRRTDVVRIFPIEASIQKDEWQLQRRCVSLGPANPE